jgi:malonyl CoA-acyl carrier protein transacylase
VNDESTEPGSSQSSIHERLGELCIKFHQLQDELLSEADAAKGARLQQIASALIVLNQEQNDQLLGELFLSEHSNYNFTKPLYIGVSLVELIRRYNLFAADSAIDDSKLEQMVVAALGHNLGLLAYEKRVYESQEEYSVEDKRQLREHYPQQSADILKAAGLDQALIQDVVRNHNGQPLETGPVNAHPVYLCRHRNATKPVGRTTIYR